MTPDRFVLVKQLFEELCDLPPEYQAARLGELTDDAEIAGTVKKLLQQTKSDHPRASRPIAAAMSELAGGQINVGDTLGVWKLTAEIGLGGMGRVFRAARSDGQFEQDAAVKVLQGLPSTRALEYLSRERQILASLIHPNIARLYDGGATPGGQPYLVMEYVDGVAIDRYVGMHHAPVSVRLGLMRDVCEALSFAHQRLVVHCDIKPSNIMVTKSGRPMLLDFGIARLLDSEPVNEPGAALPADASGKHTLARAFTPQYASPEQQNGEILTTATDVYSLGCLLKELLAVADASHATPKADVELHAIVAKATHAGVAARYATAAALAADFERYLSRKPLLAMPRTAGYISRKFVARFWPWLAATMVVVATVGMATQRVVIERDRARAAESASKQTTDFLVSVFDSGNPDAKSGDIPASRLLAAAETRLETQFAGRPDTQAELLSAIGRVQYNMGQSDKAVVSLKRAIALERQLDRPVTLAQMLNRLAWIDVDVYGGKEGPPMAKEALALLEEHAPDSEVLAESLALSGHFRIFEGRFAEAMPLLQRSLAIREKRDPQSLGTAQTLAYLAQYHYKTGAFAESIAYVRKSLAITQQQLGADDPRSLEVEYDLAVALHNGGDLPAAEATFRRVIYALTRLHGDSNMMTGKPMAMLARVLDDAGRLREAIALNSRLLVIIEKNLGRESVPYFIVSNNLANQLRRSGKLSKSIEILEWVLAAARKNYEADKLELAVPIVNLGRALGEAGQYERTDKLFTEALEIYQRRLGSAHADVMNTRDDLAINAVNAGRIEDAAAHLAAISQPLPRASASYRLRHALAVAMLAARRGFYDEALAGFVVVEKEADAIYGAGDPWRWLARVGRAELLAQRNQGDDLAQSRKLAADILANVSDELEPGAPVLVRVRRLQAR